MMETKPLTQSEKFERAARDLDCDDEPDRFAERLGKLVKHKAVEKPDERCST